MELIDRYVYAVTQHLPENTREDVSRELRANIEDMLPEVPIESDVRDVLIKLGNPNKLADEYCERKRYLIGPSLYESYFSVLKLVICIITIVMICLTLLDWAINPPGSAKISQMPLGFFFNLITASFEGILQGFLWVTISFVILEKVGVNEGKIPFVKKKWSPEDLPAIPLSKKGKISRIETVFSMFCTIFFTALIYFQAQLIGIYTKGDRGLTLIAPLFVKERLHAYIPIILIFAVIQLIIFIWKFITMSWNFPLAIANAAHNIALSAFICVMISDKLLFNQDLLSKFADLIKTSQPQFTTIWFTSSWIFAVVFVGISLWDSIMGFVKCKK